MEVNEVERWWEDMENWPEPDAKTSPSSVVRVLCGASMLALQHMQVTHEGERIWLLGDSAMPS